MTSTNQISSTTSSSTSSSLTDFSSSSPNPLPLPKFSHDETQICWGAIAIRLKYVLEKQSELKQLVTKFDSELNSITVTLSKESQSQSTDTASLQSIEKQKKYKHNLTLKKADASKKLAKVEKIAKALKKGCRLFERIDHINSSSLAAPSNDTSTNSSSSSSSSSSKSQKEKSVAADGASSALFSFHPMVRHNGLRKRKRVESPVPPTAVGTVAKAVEAALPPPSKTKNKSQNMSSATKTANDDAASSRNTASPTEGTSTEEIDNIIGN